MARLDPRFNALDASSNNTFSEALFDKTNKSILSAAASKPLTDLKNKSMSNYVDTENTKKFQVSFNMGHTSNYSLLEQYRNRENGNNERTDNNDAKMLTGREENEYKQQQSYHANNTLNSTQQPQQTAINEPQTKRVDTNTPMYTKNPNMANNKIGEIIEASVEDTKKNTPIVFANKINDPLIEPSPSGITRCYVKFDETEILRSKVPYIPSNDAVQVNYLNPNQRPVAQLVDSSTSPFVVLKTNQSKIPEVAQYDRNKAGLMQKPQSIETNLKSIETYVTASKFGTETKLVKKQDGKKIDTLKRLEKSKVIFVNLTPKPNHPTSYVNQPQSRLNLTNEENFHMVNKAFLNNETNNQTAMKESVVSSRTQRTMYDEEPAFNESFTHPNKTIETPVSSKFYSKPQSDRLKAIREESNEEAVNMSGANPLLYKRNLSYYDNVMNRNDIELNDDNEDNEHSYHPSIRNNQTQMTNTTQNDVYHQYKYQQMHAPQMVENVQHISQNTSEDYDNMKTIKQQKTGGLRRYSLSRIDENAEADLLKEEHEHQEKNIKTYYDGKKCWTSLTSSKSEYDNQNFRLNEGYESSQDSLKRQANEDGVDGDKQKSETRVKIQLPEDENSFVKSVVEERKSRKCQCFCFNLLVFLIFLLVIGILAYFIGLDSFTREKLFDLDYWKNVFSIRN